MPEKLEWKSFCFAQLNFQYAHSNSGIQVSKYTF